MEEASIFHSENLIPLGKKTFKKKKRTASTRKVDEFKGQ